MGAWWTKRHSSGPLFNWTKPTGIDTSLWPALRAFQARVAARLAVRDAMKADGLIK